MVLTGGEPMLFADWSRWPRRFARLGRHITIETAGTLYLPVDCDLMSISPKLVQLDAPPEQGHPPGPRRHERAGTRRR